MAAKFGNPHTLHHHTLCTCITTAVEFSLSTWTGREGRVTKKDILAYLKNRPADGVAPTPIAAAAPKAAPATERVPQPISVSGQDEIIQMDRMRKMIAERMVDSKRISPHVTSFVEADVTEIVFWRNRVKQSFNKRHMNFP